MGQLSMNVIESIDIVSTRYEINKDQNTQREVKVDMFTVLMEIKNGTHIDKQKVERFLYEKPEFAQFVREEMHNAYNHFKDYITAEILAPNYVAKHRDNSVCWLNRKKQEGIIYIEAWIYVADYSTLKRHFDSMRIMHY